MNKFFMIMIMIYDYDYSNESFINSGILQHRAFFISNESQYFSHKNKTVMKQKYLHPVFYCSL